MRRFDLVKIDDDPTFVQSGMEGGCEAILLHTYQEKHGGTSGQDRWCVFVRGRGRLAFYNENRLTYIESDRHDLYGLWTAEIQAPNSP